MKAALAGRTSVFVEGILLIGISLVAMAEGFRLVIYREPNTLYDPLGPGYYALAVSVCLLAVSITDLVSRLRNPVQVAMVPVDRRMKLRLVGTVAACAIYIVLINLVGYLLATIAFFFIQLRIEGLKSWLFVTVLSVVFAGLYYLVFVKVCHVVFPAGAIFG